MVAIGGSVAPGFEGVREAFLKNFDDGLETGAAFAAYRRGEMLADLWGGEATPGRPWQDDSLQLIYSGSKGLTAICLTMLLDRGQIELDEPVSRYWPAFAKPEILVRHIVSHTARLPGITEPTSWADMLDPRVMAKKLERQVPFDDPRCAFTYHPVTYGWLCGELLRQVDGRTLGQFFAEEIAQPFGLDIWFGLPEREEARVTTIRGDSAWGHLSRNLLDPTPSQLAADPAVSAVWYNPPLFGADCGKWNSRALHAIEMPGAGAIGTARSIAQLYAVVAAGDGRLFRPETLLRATQTIAEGPDLLNENDPRRHGLGFSLQVPDKMQFGPRMDGFGHGGAGGSVHGAWPGDGIGFSYAMNRLIDGDDPRAARLLDALARAID